MTKFYVPPSAHPSILPQAGLSWHHVPKWGGLVPKNLRHPVERRHSGSFFPLGMKGYLLFHLVPPHSYQM